MVVDANVLWDYNLRDVLVHLKLLGAPVRTTCEILDELYRTLVAAGRLTPEQALRQRPLLETALKDSFIEGFHRHVSGVVLPDQDDRHVLAAAIEASPSAILTFNLKDFPDEDLHPHGVIAIHPDTWLCRLYAEDPDLVTEAIEGAARLRRRAPRTPMEIVDALSRSTPDLAARLRGQI